MTITADQVKAHRETFGVGLMEARRVLEKDDRDSRLEKLATQFDVGTPMWELIAIVMEMNK